MEKLQRLSPLQIAPWALLAALFGPTFKMLYTNHWEKLDYTHAYFILPISLYLVWKKRQTLTETPIKHTKTSTLTGLSLTVLAIFIYLLGRQNDYTSVQVFSILPFITGITIYLYGTKILKTLWFPITYIALLVPPPAAILDSVTLPMRKIITVLTDKILLLANYPIERQGLLLTINGHEIYMGAPCSGFRSLITLIALGTVYIYTTKTTNKNKLILTALILPLALLGNLIRVLSVCIVTNYTGHNRFQQIYHDASGLVMFVIVIIGLMALENILTKTQAKKGGE